MAVPVGPIDYMPTPGYRGVLNNIAFLISNPCGADPWIYLETLAPVAGDLIVEFLSFGLSDILIGYAHPKPRRGWNRFDRERKAERRVGRDGERRRIRRFEIPEIGNEIGKRLPGSKFVRSIQTDALSHLIWVPIDIAERALWWWMVADLSQRGLYEWASEIFLEQCLGGASSYAAQQWADGPDAVGSTLVKSSQYGAGASADRTTARASSQTPASLAVGISWGATPRDLGIEWSQDVIITCSGIRDDGQFVRLDRVVTTVSTRPGKKPQRQGGSLKWRATGMVQLFVGITFTGAMIYNDASSASWASVKPIEATEA